LEGEASAAAWMAKKTGTTLTNAIKVLETSKRVADLPETDKALRGGKLSEVQAEQIASAAAADPVREQDLLSTARQVGVEGLRQHCARVKAAASNEAARHERAHRNRSLRTWADSEGTFHLHGRLTPEAGAVVLAGLAPYKERIFQAARNAGYKDSYEAYGADALVQMAEHARICDKEPKRNSPGAMVHVMVDHSALVRGQALPGETCEIAGVGPISVAAARALSSDAILSALVTKGSDITTVAHLGRSIPAHLRTAVDARDQVCCNPGCSERRFLEIDHNTPVVEQGKTCLSNLAKLCGRCHYLKTHHGYKLLGKPGAWEWKAPDTPPDTPRPTPTRPSQKNRTKSPVPVSALGSAPPARALGSAPPARTPAPLQPAFVLAPP